MSDIILKDKYGNPATYSGVDKITVQKVDGGTATFSEGGGVGIQTIVITPEQIISTNPVTVRLTEEQQQIVTDLENKFVEFDASALGLGIATLTHTKTGDQHWLSSTVPYGYINRGIENITSFAAIIEEGSTNLILYSMDLHKETDTVIDSSNCIPTSKAVYNGLASKQDTLTAGTGITISDNIIKSGAPTIAFTTSQVISPDPMELQLTDEQKAIVEDINVGLIHLDLSGLGQSRDIYIVKYWTYPDSSTIYFNCLYGDCEYVIFAYYKSNSHIKLLNQYRMQEKLTAGSGISINDAVISSTVPVVSGTNDGTNWSTITIDGTTKNIPAGGGSAEGAVKYSEAQNLTDAQKTQARENQGLYYTKDEVEKFTWDGDITGKSTMNIPFIYNGIPNLEIPLYKFNADASWFNYLDENKKYKVKLNGCTKTLYTGTAPTGEPTVLNWRRIGAWYDPSWTQYNCYELNLTQPSWMQINKGWGLNKRVYVQGDGYSYNYYYFKLDKQSECQEDPYAIGSPSLAYYGSSGAFGQAYSGDSYISKIESNSLDFTSDNIYDIVKWEVVTNDTNNSITYVGYANVKLAADNIQYWYNTAFQETTLPVIAICVQSNIYSEIGTYLLKNENGIEDGNLLSWGVGYVNKVWEDNICTVPIINENRLCGNFLSSYSWGELSGNLCDLDFTEAKEAFLAGADVILLKHGTSFVAGISSPVNKVIRYKAIEYLPHIDGPSNTDHYAQVEALRFVNLEFGAEFRREGISDMLPAGRFGLNNCLFCKMIDREPREYDEYWKDIIIDCKAGYSSATEIGKLPIKLTEGFSTNEWLIRLSDDPYMYGDSYAGTINNALKTNASIHASTGNGDRGSEWIDINTNSLDSWRNCNVPSGSGYSYAKLSYYKPELSTYWNDKYEYVEQPASVTTLGGFMDWYKPKLYVDSLVKVDVDNKEYLKHYRLPVSSVAVSNTGTSTEAVNYITIDGLEYKLAGGSSDHLSLLIPLFHSSTWTPEVLPHNPEASGVGNFVTITLDKQIDLSQYSKMEETLMVSGVQNPTGTANQRIASVTYFNTLGNVAPGADLKPVSSSIDSDAKDASIKSIYVKDDSMSGYYGYGLNTDQIGYVCGSKTEFSSDLMTYRYVQTPCIANWIGREGHILSKIRFGFSSNDSTVKYRDAVLKLEFFK